MARVGCVPLMLVVMWHYGSLTLGSVSALPGLSGTSRCGLAKSSLGCSWIANRERGFRPWALVARNGVDAKAKQKASWASGQLSGSENMLCGALAGFVARLFVAPLDLAKIRMQLQRGHVGQANMKIRYINTLQTLKTVAKEEGILALWRGNTPAQLMVMSFVAVKFASYNKLRNWLKARQEDLQLSTGSVKGGNLQGGVINVVAGGCAGAIATSASYPLDLLRTRLASCTGPLIGALRSEVTQVWQSAGVPGFYRGMSTALVTIVPYMALQLSSYELMKGFYMVFRSTYLEVGVVGGVADKERMGMLPSTMIGALAGGMSKIMTLPLDLCKKRLQMGMMTESERLFGLMSRIVKEEGFLALWKGGWPSILKTVPATAITFAVYEMCKTTLLTMRETELLQLAREGAIAGSNH